ncbi:MAG: DUF4124 domain-containing protein [Pseudoxanthomonas sp.]
MLRSRVPCLTGSGLAFMLLLAQGPTQAQSTIYRCTDASGSMTIQNNPCPTGSKEDKRTVKGVESRPLPTVTASPTKAAPPAPAAAAPPPQPSTQIDLNPGTRTPAASAKPLPSGIIRDTTPPVVAGDPLPASGAAPPANDRLPPPVMFQCTAYDGGTYISEDPTPPPRCVTLDTAGVGGNTRLGAGATCEMVRDTCARVTDRDLCRNWRKRLGEVEVAWRFGRPENTERNKAEFDRVRRIVEASACGEARGE